MIFILKNFDRGLILRPLGRNFWYHKNLPLNESVRSIPHPLGWGRTLLVDFS